MYLICGVFFFVLLMNCNNITTINDFDFDFEKPDRNLSLNINQDII